MKIVTDREAMLIQGGMTNSEVATIVGVTIVGAALCGGTGFMTFGIMAKLYGASLAGVGMVASAGFVLGAGFGGYFTKQYVETTYFSNSAAV